MRSRCTCRLASVELNIREPLRLANTKNGIFSQSFPTWFHEKSRLTDRQVLGVLKQADVGQQQPVGESVGSSESGRSVLGIFNDGGASGSARTPDP